jgi:hypothetical protein
VWWYTSTIQVLERLRQEDCELEISLLSPKKKLGKDVWRAEEPLHTAEINATTLEIGMGGPQKIKNTTTIWSSYPTPSYTLEGIKVITQWRHLHTHVNYSTVHNSQVTESA